LTNEKLDKLEDAVRAMRRSYHDAIAREIETTSKTYAEIARQYGVSEQTAYTVARERGLRRNSQQSINNGADAMADGDAVDGGSHE
jgi:transposase-like protein